MSAADIGLDDPSNAVAPLGDSAPRQARPRRFILALVLFLAALCATYAVGSYYSDHLVAQRQEKQMDKAAERFNSNINSAAGSNGH